MYEQWWRWCGGVLAIVGSTTMTIDSEMKWNNKTQDTTCRQVMLSMIDQIRILSMQKACDQLAKNGESRGAAENHQKKKKKRACTKKIIDNFLLYLVRLDLIFVKLQSFLNIRKVLSWCFEDFCFAKLQRDQDDTVVGQSYVDKNEWRKNKFVK